MLTSVLKTVHYATSLLKIGGARVFFFQLTRQIYSRDTLLGLEKALDTNGVQIKSQIRYGLRKASQRDIDELVSRAKTESAQSAHELLERKWFFESGFRDCYIARTIDTAEPCGIAWLVSPDDEVTGFGSRLPVLKEGEVLLENCYTFEKYRGKGIMPAIVHELQEKARENGSRRMLTYVRRDNAASLQVFKKLKFSKFEEASELKLLFRTKRRHG